MVDLLKEMTWSSNLQKSIDILESCLRCAPIHPNVSPQSINQSRQFSESCVNCQVGSIRCQHIFASLFPNENCLILLWNISELWKIQYVIIWDWWNRTIKDSSRSTMWMCFATCWSPLKLICLAVYSSEFYSKDYLNRYGFKIRNILVEMMADSLEEPNQRT